MRTRSTTILIALQVIALLLFGTAYGDPTKNTRDWEKDPVLKANWALSQNVMGEYEAWSEEWKKSAREPTSEDQTINQLVESFFVYLINLWALAPNPELQVQCLRFLDTQVPPEFDGLWAFVFIEFSNVARDANGQPLQSDHLTNLKRRAMGTK